MPFSNGELEPSCIKLINRQKDHQTRLTAGITLHSCTPICLLVHAGSVMCMEASAARVWPNPIPRLMSARSVASVGFCAIWKHHPRGKVRTSLPSSFVFAARCPASPHFEPQRRPPWTTRGNATTHSICAAFSATMTSPKATAQHIPSR